MASQRRGDDPGATNVPGSEGLSSLRYQALNKDSYRLDSPPFTGAAVSGAGPVTQGLENPVMNRVNTAAGQSREASSRERTSDRDVPHWNLSLVQQNKSSSPDELDEELDASGLMPYPQEVNRSPHTKAIPRQGQSMDTYTFPRHRFSTQMRDETKQPLVVVACGSFSPPTYLHLRMFEMAKDQVFESGEYELLAGYYSPVSDQYKKAGLAKATHRVRMCELAVERSSNWLMVDAWESLQGEYQRTAIVLDHFNEEINGKNNDKGLLLSNGNRKPIKIMLLAGGDLIQSMGEPGVWADTDLHHILGRYGCLIVERTGADVWSFLLSHDLLWQHRRNLIVVKQTIYNDISSSKVRLFVRRGYSIKYLLPNTVIQYIEQNRLYQLSE
ncbi:nicotinamide-nucleotide adenylyltransferase [Malassezia yamatoensis]|uniref:Nicotinamide-nucleotide adenylyltransferase n=1 Tax=Malassezia yamatoensis TaxID=253288 RepID=A0AAJ6CGP7_9BASI|nr:nicotinamide-nucleotide adenylyltransferase [Malassezia yamatoensis]